MQYPNRNNLPLFLKKIKCVIKQQHNEILQRCRDAPADKSCSPDVKKKKKKKRSRLFGVDPIMSNRLFLSYHTDNIFIFKLAIQI